MKMMTFQSTRPMRDATQLLKTTILRLEFQSTRPMRDATKEMAYRGIGYLNFNPRVLCGTRQRYAFEITVELIFQSTRPMRDATAVYGFLKTTIRFQSTRPMRDATCCPVIILPLVPHISIHASYAGRDKDTHLK